MAAIELEMVEQGESPPCTIAAGIQVIAGAMTTPFRRMTASLIPYTPSAEENEATAEAVQKACILPHWLLLAGSHEIYLTSFYKAVLVEFIGSASFSYLHIAIVLAGQNFKYPPLEIGVGHAILLSFFILQFAMSSGAHFNSLVTIATASTGQTPIIRGVCYVIAQISGAATGAAVMRRSIPEATARSVNLGSCNTGTLEAKEVLAIQFFFCLTSLYATYGTALNPRQREIYGRVLPPFIVGATLGLIIFSSSSLASPPFTGAGTNPSLCLGTALVNSSIVGEDEAMRDQWVYWVGALMAVVVHTVVYGVAPPHHWDHAKQIFHKAD